MKEMDIKTIKKYTKIGDWIAPSNQNGEVRSALFYFHFIKNDRAYDQLIGTTQFLPYSTTIEAEKRNINCYFLYLGIQKHLRKILRKNVYKYTKLSENDEEYGLLAEITNNTYRKIGYKETKRYIYILFDNVCPGWVTPYNKQIQPTERRCG